MSTKTIPPHSSETPPITRNAVFGKRGEIPALAPDGLPWPDGYFDQPVKQTLAEAIAMYGVRPSHYVFGRPGYTLEESLRAEFKVKLSDEPEELQTQWNKVWDDWKAKGTDGCLSLRPVGTSQW